MIMIQIGWNIDSVFLFCLYYDCRNHNAKNIFFTVTINH